MTAEPQTPSEQAKMGAFSGVVDARCVSRGTCDVDMGITQSRHEGEALANELHCRRPGNPWAFAYRLHPRNPSAREIDVDAPRPWPVAALLRMKDTAALWLRARFGK